MRTYREAEAGVRRLGWRVSKLALPGQAVIGLVALTCVSLAANSGSNMTVKRDEGFQTSVPNALLLDPESDSVLFDKNGDQLVPPASLAKLMTLEFVFNEIKQGRIKLDDEYVISENAWRKGGAPSHGSTMFAAIHSRVKVEDLSTASSSTPPTTPASRSPKRSPATRRRSARC